MAPERRHNVLRICKLVYASDENGSPNSMWLRCSDEKHLRQRILRLPFPTACADMKGASAEINRAQAHTERDEYGMEPKRLEP